MIESLLPDWPAPLHVRAVTTLRGHGFSEGVYASLNLADHVGDNPVFVQKNRQKLTQTLMLQRDPFWLHQVHGIDVIDIDTASRKEKPYEADAAFTRTKQQPCVVLTADCLPVLFCDRSGTIVAAVHAGWKGLLSGVIEATVKAMKIPGEDILAWMGPAIGPDAFEVDDGVREQFLAVDANASHAFKPKSHKWLVDIFLLGKQRLNSVGVTAVYGGGECTYSDSERFFSFRRERDTGRLASMIWIT